MKNLVLLRLVRLTALIAATSFVQFQAAGPCLAQQREDQGTAAATCRGMCPCSNVSKQESASGCACANAGDCAGCPGKCESGAATQCAAQVAGMGATGVSLLPLACMPSTCPSCVVARLPVGTMPGCTSFLDEENRQLAARREQLARDLVSYLTSRNHSAEHILQVLQMSLESAANDAHREAMASRNSAGFVVDPMPRVAPENRSISELNARLDQQQQQLDRMEKGMFAMARRLGGHQEAMNSSTPDRTPVVRVPLPVAVASPSVNPEVQQLRQRIVDLESRLREMQGASMASPVMPGGTVGDVSPTSLIPATPSPATQRDRQQTLQPTTWNSVIPPGRESSGMPSGSYPVRLVPMVERTYYVGDLMSPPFASGTLKLMQIIKAVVDPESWDRASMEIVSPSVSLHIFQTEENHDRIERLLKSLRTEPLNR